MSGSLSVVAFEGELNSIVKEYLDFGGFDKTLQDFERECEQKGKPIADLDVKSKSNQKLIGIQNELMKRFHEGKRNKYFTLWNESLPVTVRDGDSVSQKLEFYLNIYFAVYPIRFAKGQDEGEKAMQGFKQYLETRGSTLSQTTEFLPFYALPFVPSPTSHPSYKELFSDTWLKDLEVRLEKFLTLALKSTPQPKLFELYQINQLQQQLVECERKTMSYIKRHNKVQADYHNLIGVTADLVDAMEATLQGKPITPEKLQTLCSRLFSTQFHQSVDLTRPGTAGDVLRASIAPQHDDKFAYKTLDYEKVKHDMAHSTDRNKALLLQALRWRLTQSAPHLRDPVMTAFVQNDLLGCATPGEHRDVVLSLLTAPLEILRQSASRMFNAFASMSAGRTYLAQNQDLFKGLMDNLRSEDKDSITREMILGALQKLSLRRNLQTAMIDKGVIEWLVKVLEDNDSLSDYTLEYSVALLMNLCLRTAGTDFNSPRATNQTLKVLSDLLGHENQEIRPYVNGALYSILAIPTIREEAKAMGMEEILRCFIKEDQPDMNRQIEFIIKQLNSTESVDEYESDDEEDEEDEEDQDAMESDLDKDEILKPEGDELSGEPLLAGGYLTRGANSARARRGQQKDFDGMNEPLRRPVTPSHRRLQDPSRKSQPRFP
ncbi:hypothetical protein ScPMuIL_005164 [Solemya velum]